MIIETSSNSNDEKEIHMIHERTYYEMVSFRRKYEKIKANEILRLGFDSYIQGCKPIGNFIMKVEIISGGCCDYCNSFGQEKN